MKERNYEKFPPPPSHPHLLTERCRDWGVVIPTMMKAWKSIPVLRPNVWTKSWQKPSEFFSLLFKVTSTALPWDFYFFKLTHWHATSYSFYNALVYTVKEKGGKPDRKPHLPSLWFKKSIQKPEVWELSSLCPEPQRNCTFTNSASGCSIRSWELLPIPAAGSICTETTAIAQITCETYSSLEYPRRLWHLICCICMMRRFETQNVLAYFKVNFFFVSFSGHFLSGLSLSSYISEYRTQVAFYISKNAKCAHFYSKIKWDNVYLFICGNKKTRKTMNFL